MSVTHQLRARGISNFLCTLATCSSLIGCGSNTPYLDSKFGQALQDAKQNQSLDSNSVAANPMTARELRVPMDNYLRGNSAPAALGGVGTTNSAPAASAR